MSTNHYPARYWHQMESGKIQCDLCPRHCKLKEGQRGSCFVRQRLDNQMVLTTYGRSSGFCIDPVEKKPLNHYFPGSAVLSFGTAGCNLSCKFCQNWDISTSKDMDRIADRAYPESIANAAKQEGCKSVAVTYNDPIIFLEYAKDVADACHEQDVKVIAVSAGYIDEKPREEFFSFIDAANIDLKGFTEDFYKRLTGGKLAPVLDTLRYVYHHTDTWLEITTLLIPGENDSDGELIEQSQWIHDELGPEVPIHFSAFHPDHKMRDKSPTSLESLVRARRIAQETGLQYVYTGNVYYAEGDTTYCPHCGKVLIVRDWYNIRRYMLTASGKCPSCDIKIAGKFDSQAGHWGSKRKPIAISWF